MTYLDLAKTLRTPENVRPLWVVHTRAGQRYTRDGFQSVWQRVKAGFRFHDLRRAGATDIEDADRQKFTGHASPQMAERYNAKPIKSPSH
jgi:integrase